ncbi:unnamed protein product [Paramecium primaurelia]|uniref:Transmembrane protein n=1 Tax=Paramecium primaurelia TaxID=5886 RepID=A0A8S1QHU9_PARPR|nr:unnamed protein product [Paramecium primaurelia]
MHRFTLTFLNKDVEQQYQSINKKQSIEFQQQQKWIFIVMGLYFTIIKIIEQEWVSLGFIVFNWLVVIFSYKFIAQPHKLYDFFLTFVVVSYNLYFPITKYFSIIQSENFYVDGYFISVGTFGVINIFSFRYKTIIIAIIFTSLVSLSMISEVNFWNQLIKSTIFTSLYLQHLYCSEKHKKYSFLNHLKRTTTLKGIYDLTNIQTFIVHYKAETKKIELVQKDDQQEIQKQILDDFDDYLNNMKIQQSRSSGKFVSILGQDPINQSQRKQELKSYLFELFLRDQRINKTMTDNQIENNQILGEAIYEQEYYSILITKVFDIHPCFILILQEKKKEVQLEELSLKNKMLKKSLDQTSLIFKHQVRISLIYFQWIYKFANKKEEILLINRCLQSIHGQIIKANNDFQNIIDFNTINSDFQQSIIKKFNIIDCLNELTRTICFYDINKDIKFNIINQLNTEQQNIQQDEKQLKQLFYNLLFFVSHSSQTVTITLQHDIHGQPSKPVIKIKINYQGPNLSNQQLQGLQIINPQNLGELLHNSQKPLDLEIPLSLMIIRKIGPYDKMRLQQNKKAQNYIEFYIFSVLEEHYHLIPIYSLHPLNCLILREKNIYNSKKFTSFYEKMQTSPRIQMQNYNDF